MSFDNLLLNNITWYDDRMVMGNLVFYLEPCIDKDIELDENHIKFYKDKKLVDQFGRFWSTKKDFDPHNVIELGIWDGGSIIFWFELFQPGKHIAIDIQNKSDSQFFQSYIKSHELQNRIKTYWRTNQADKNRLRNIIDSEFSSPIDLIIDDASHMYGLTKNSFNILFPLLRPGGLYIIEDWAWAHWEEFQDPSHMWSNETALTKLIFDLVEATGSSNEVISELYVFQGFAVVERGPTPESEIMNFNIDDLISRRQKPSFTKKIYNTISKIL